MDRPAPFGPVEFHYQLQQCDDIECCAALFREQAAAYGFDTYACGEVDIDERERNVFLIVEWPERWRKFYLSSGLVDRDPLIDALRARRASFTWSDLRKDGSFLRAGAEALRRLAEQGWREGFVASVARGGSQYGLVSLAGRATDLSPEERRNLGMVCESLLARIRSLGPPSRFPVPPAGLTGRELDALKLVAVGRTDAEIAQELGISRFTAHQHVESARKRLGARSRAQMAARAVAFGIVAA
jgi:LuxR family quorum sensing-dependent transcriptional regulator